MVLKQTCPACFTWSPIQRKCIPMYIYDLIVYLGFKPAITVIDGTDAIQQLSPTIHYISNCTALAFQSEFLSHTPHSGFILFFPSRSDLISGSLKKTFQAVNSKFIFSLSFSTYLAFLGWGLLWWIPIIHQSVRLTRGVQTLTDIYWGILTAETNLRSFVSAYSHNCALLPESL